MVLDLLRALRDAGASLAAIRAVLEQDATLGELLAVRLADLEASIQRQKALAATLRLALATGEPTIDDLRRISQMIGHSHAQRHATATAFLDMMTDSIRFDPRWRETMVNLIAAPSLPDDPLPQPRQLRWEVTWLENGLISRGVGLVRCFSDD